MQRYFKASAQAKRMLDEQCEPGEILSFLTSAAEQASPGVVASILYLDEKGLLRNCASPKLPQDYLQAIDGIKPDAQVGTCAAAAATGQIVITEDFYSDSKWAELRHLPLALGFRAAWSVPIKSSEGKVMGTFGMYFPTVRKPTSVEFEGLQVLAKAAAEIMERNEMVRTT